MAGSAEELGREELVQLVDGRTDAEIADAVGALGTDAVLARALNGMVDAFVPERAGHQAAVVQWDVTVPDGLRSWQFTTEDGTASVVEGTPAPARVTLALALPDFLRFLAGRLDGMQAFMSGRLRVSGDLMLAQAMQSWFDRPA
ncbi:MAG: SCP2 sterol-binding domain-containing protein [Acidimicrobiales bacterium]